MLKILHYTSDDLQTASEFRLMMPEFLIVEHLAEVKSSESIQQAATRLAREAHERFGELSVCLLTDVYFDDPSAFYMQTTPFRGADNLGTETASSDSKGVMRIVAAATLDGVTIKLEERSVPGSLCSVPQGDAGTALDRMWIPNGYRCTISELNGFQHHLNRRAALYNIVRNEFGVAVAQEAFEAHITVALGEGQTYDFFKESCATLGIKAIHIELSKGIEPSHFITASMHLGTLKSVERETAALERNLKRVGLKPVRKKIEAMIQSELVPLSDAEARARPRSNYFELHTKVTIDENQDLSSLELICARFGAHLARSASNRVGDSRLQRFVTMRFHHQGKKTAEKVFDMLLLQLMERGYRPSHNIREYVLMDTNLDLDAGWADSAKVSACYTSCEVLADGSCPFQEPPYNSQRILGCETATE